MINVDKYIRNKELNQIITQYIKSIPKRGAREPTNPAPVNKIIKILFSFSWEETREGLTFWNCIHYSLLRDPYIQCIHEWKSIRDWFEGDEILSKSVEFIFDEIRDGIYKSSLKAYNLRSAAMVLDDLAMTSDTYSEKFLPKIDFIMNFGRMPNDFDDF